MCVVLFVNATIHEQHRGREWERHEWSVNVSRLFQVSTREMFGSISRKFFSNPPDFQLIVEFIDTTLCICSAQKFFSGGQSRWYLFVCSVFLRMHQCVCASISLRRTPETDYHFRCMACTSISVVCGHQFSQRFGNVTCLSFCHHDFLMVKWIFGNQE